MSVHFASDLTRWLDAGQHALDHAQALTVDQLRALVATPDTPGRDGTHRRTWWIEEAERVMKTRVRDGFPLTGVEADVHAWQDRQDHYTNEIESLMDAHAECLGRASAVPTVSRTKKPKRLTAADDALSHALPDAA